MNKLCLAVLALAWVAGCGGNSPAAPLLVTDLDIRAPRPGTEMGTAYLKLTNNHDEALTITRVSSPQFGRVELHETVSEGEVSRMRALSELEIEAGTTVHLAPGQKHLMLMQPRAGAGAVSLSFWSGEALLVSVTADSGGG